VKSYVGCGPHQIRSVAKLLLYAMWILCFAGIAIAQQEAPADLSPDELVNRLMAVTNQKLTREVEQERSALMEALWKQGESAIPAIVSGLSRGNDVQRVYLVHTVARIPGDSSTSVLVEAVAQTSFPRAANRALAALENRTINRPLSPPELQALTDQVRQKGVIGAGLASRVLARCVEVPIAGRLTPIVERFESELISPAEIGRVVGSYVSPRVFARNQFLLAFSYLGEPAIPALTQKRCQATGNVEIEKWWALALGMAGDRSVAPYLEGVVRNDPDKYIRCTAVSAYAHSAKQDAIPLLESLLTDTTESEYKGCILIPGKVFLIRNVAKDELATLRREKAATSGQK